MIIICFCVTSVVEGDTVGNVRDGEDPAVDSDYTDEITAVTAHFDGFYSQSCGGIVRYEWAVGIDGIGKEEVFPFIENGIIFVPDGSGKAQVCMYIFKWIFLKIIQLIIPIVDFKFIS